MKRIKEDFKHSIIINKSEFICYLFHVNDEEEVKEHIKTVKKAHPFANHHCTAYIMNNQSIKRCNDNGEPTGTAGRPMLEVLEKNEIDDVLAIVVRYFGGIKLGTGGLIRAYTNATKTALELCQIAVMCLGKKVNIYTDYNTIGKVLYELSQRGLTQLDSKYTDVIVLTIILANDDVEEFTKKIIEISAGKSKLEVVEELYFEKVL